MRFDQCDNTCTADCGHCKGDHDLSGFVAMRPPGRCRWVSRSKGVAMPCHERPVPGSVGCPDHLIEHERNRT